MHYKFENKIGGWSKESYTWHEYEWGSEYMRQAQCVVPFRSIYVKQENKNKDWRKEMEEQRVCREEWMDQNRERDPMSLSIVSPCLSLTSLLVNIKPNIQQTTIIPSLPSISINNISLLPLLFTFGPTFIIAQIQKHPHSTPSFFGPNLCFYSFPKNSI